ncbi:MAG: chromosome segregation protein SMC [Clostridia bacterium]|nr:chromosome segregation protein SMC [Clostridia bacterium]
MLLKSLELHGFKSFPDKTVLHFSDGMTAVVGPNGSGKSNISDAIRWVLGEQSSKSLRGSKMEDVIFNGTAQRRPMGYAEVTMVIDNTAKVLEFDADEVRVTRRCYRSGGSEYQLNGATVRLEDIRLLFMNTGLGRDGYSIIGQGRIDEIVTSRSQNRREILDEAAGIAKYRYKKDKAENSLRKTQENLDRLHDILQELEDRVGPLEKQAEKAKKFLEYAGERKELEIGLWLRTMNESRQVLRDLDAKLENARIQYEAAGASIDACNEEVERIAMAAGALEVQMDEIRRQASALEEQAAACDSQVAVWQNDIFHNEENIKRIEGEIADADAGTASIEEDITRSFAEIEAKKEAIAQAEQKRLSLAEEMEQLARSNDETTDRMDALSAEASRLALQVSETRVQSVTNESSLREITMRLSQLTAGSALRIQQAEHAAEELRESEKALQTCREQAESLQNTVAGYEYRYQNRMTKLTAAKEALDKQALDVESRQRRVRMLEEMERNLDGFHQSVRTIMKQSERGALRGILGPVSRLIHADAGCALAVETALGAAAQNVVCEREEDAKRGIAYLKETKGGRATFLPLVSAKGNVLSDLPKDEPGFVGLASDLVTCDDKFRVVARSLLGRTVVAEDIDYAVAIARRYGYKFRIVTLDGQMVNAGGSMTGGSSVKEAGLLSRRTEIERLQKETAEKTESLEKAREAYRQMQQDVSAVEAQLTGARGELTTAQEDMIRLEGEVRRLQEQADANRLAAEEAAAEIQTLNERASACQQGMETAEKEMAALLAQQQQAEARLTELSGGRQQLTNQREELSERIAQQKLAVVSIEKEIENLESSITALRSRQQDSAGHIELLRGQIAALQASNKDIEQRMATQQQQAADLRAQAAGSADSIAALVAKRAEGEARQTQLRLESREKTDERERMGQEVVRLEEKTAGIKKEADDLSRRLYEEYELTRMEAEAVAKPIEDVTAANRRVTELRNKIRALGSVNVDAIDEFKEVNERYQFLKTQITDVEQTKEQLLRQINELTVQMREVFIERFKQINYQYGVVFAELFGGGKGELRLTDPEDILGSGIDMFIQPPGKVILNLESLSGGEKALAATALLFAILKVTPSPFCVLDEVEAALDDVNVDRYATYLRRMCARTQFIAITHRRGTMEEADTLYGVTMQERGVSKLLELRASEVEQKLGLNLDNEQK